VKGGGGKERDVQAQDAKENHPVEVENVGYAEGEAEDDAEDAGPLAVDA